MPCSRSGPACAALAAAAAFAAMVLDAVAFLGGGAPHGAHRASGASRAQATSTTGRAGSAGPLRESAGASVFCAPMLATLALGVAVRARNQARRRPLRRFFGGGEKKEEEKDELTEAQKIEIERLQTEVDDFKTLAEEKKSSFERMKLEMSNFRSRTAAELNAERGKAALPIIKELLPIADEFDLASQNLKIEGAGEQAIADRFAGLFAKIFKSWKAVGVERLAAVGEEFDPELHEAVSMIPSEEYVADKVCNELRAGWVLRTKGNDEPQCLRPALVCVSSGPGPS